MVKNHHIKPEDVKEITVFNEDDKYFLLYPLEKRRRPENPVDSQFSIPWAVATIFARGRVGIGDFTEESIRSADILDLSSKIRVKIDKNIGEKKGLIPAKIGVTIRSGETLIEQSEIPDEGPAKPPPFADYERKFRDCAAYAVRPRTEKQIDRLVSLVKQLDKIVDVRELVELLS